MEVVNHAVDEVGQVARIYIRGLYEGDVELLRSVFHETAMLQSPNLRLTREEWLKRVGSRPKPCDAGSKADFQVLSIDIEQKLAMVKVFCPLFEFRYVDFLSLLKEDGRWLIVNKTYADSSHWLNA